MNEEPDIQQIIERLDTLYWTDSTAYMRKLNNLKGSGYKVFRNEKGKHKVQYNSNYFNEMFGGIFGGIFDGK